MAYTDNDTYRHIHFAVMAIESGARKLGISGKEMHDRLLKQGLIHRRLIKRYEDLHTQSLDWVADDISETLLTGRKKYERFCIMAQTKPNNNDACRSSAY